VLAVLEKGSMQAKDTNARQVTSNTSCFFMIPSFSEIFNICRLLDVYKSQYPEAFLSRYVDWLMLGSGFIDNYISKGMWVNTTLQKCWQ
jgi:hypothetical protein